jgi:cobalt-zinc-cadmium efflux system outer membrane protein
MRIVIPPTWRSALAAVALPLSASIVLAQEPGPFVPPAPAASDEQATPGATPQGSEGATIRSPRLIGQALTLESLQQMAIQLNPTLEQARASIRGASGRQYQAGRMPNPTVGYMANEIGDDREAGQQGGFVEQEFVRCNKLALSEQVVGREVQQAEQIYMGQELRVKNAVRREFLAVLVAERRRELAGELVRIAREARQANEARLKREEGTQIELSQSDIELEAASLLQFDAEKQLEAAWRRLRSIINRPDLAESPMAGDLESNIPELTWEQSLTTLLETSPELGEARFGIARANAKAARARVEPNPNVIVQASTQYDYATNFTIAGLQVGLPIPVLNDNRGNIADADAEVVRAAREVDRRALALQSRLADVYRDYQLGQRRVDRYRNAILPASRESLELSRTAFEKGELGYLQLLTAQRIFTERNQEYVDALASLWDTIVEIEGLLLTGGLEAPRTVGGQ